MTETDSDITRDDRDEIVITKGYESITRSYKSITRSYKREREGVGTIGLDWLLGVLLIGWREGSLVLKGIPARLVPLAWPSPHSSPHSPLPQSHPTSPSTSI